ncbi:hypothetical protein SAMN02745229_00211 [Butyrivibrio fibrisolvens DSM 3071]|uniref:Uncharacterized protein n=1 Tax=Butyrivibrio fibrisolvens DSM 3071 TaxID=1121131 RepID=A0A1M5Q6H0_BUTFI|nr:hypothetical protein [Butyrivibrio fibrisolvens]SHH09598.1 hypothetical protein SAMN02745229_00211 [Butyrivibrio fibrisolvens DSM 3071]
MKVTTANNQYSVNNWVTNNKKPNNVREYSNYLTNKYGCLTPGKNAAVSITGGLLRKAMADEKTGEWLERELGKVTDYIRTAQKAAIAHGSTLKSVSIEFGEEYSTMTTTGVFNGGGGTDSEIDEWLAKIEEKKSEKKASEKKIEQKKIESDQDTFAMEMRGKSLEDLTGDFVMKLSLQTSGKAGSFDVRG